MIIRGMGAHKHALIYPLVLSGKMLKPFVVWPKYKPSKISVNLHDASQYTTKELDGGISNDKMDQKVLVLH